MYETMSISTGLYPNLDLWNANKLHYITLPTLAINKQNSLNAFVVTGHAPLHFRDSEVKSQHRNYLT